MPSPAPRNPLLAPRNRFSGADALSAPANSIYSCQKQARVPHPLLQIDFYPPLKTVFVVVTVSNVDLRGACEQARWLSP